jgi:hypothetical protein
MEKSTLYRDLIARGEAAGEAKVLTEGIVTILTRWLGVLEPGVVQRIKIEADRLTLRAWQQEAIYLPDAEGALGLAEKIRNAPLP